MQDEDYYLILGLKKMASGKDIKSAYKKLVLKYHPNKVPREEKEKAQEKFVKISKAYAFLSNDKKCKIYDKYRKNGLEVHERGINPDQAGFGGGFPGGSGTHTFHFSGPGSVGFDPFSMFEEMFGGGMGSGG